MALKKGTVLADRFRLEEPLGEGNVGWVWRAHDEHLGRKVAVKVLKTENPGDVTLERFRLEAARPAAVQHPGIIVVYDMGVHDERLFIVTEFLAGRDLSKVLRDNPEGLATEQVIDLGIQLADALAAAHESKIVHRDLKPSNLFVLPGERLKICDFGILGDMSPEAIARTAPGTLLGTPAYMSPEQWNGQRSSPSMDLYAVGCILYEMLTGKLPFEGSTILMVAFEKHAHEVPVPPVHRKPGVPDGLNELTLRLLAKSPADRPDSAGVVASALRGIRAAMDHAAIEADKAEAVRKAVAAAEDAAEDRAASRISELEDRAGTTIAAAEARAGKAEARAERAEAGRAEAAADAQAQTTSARAALQRAAKAEDDAAAADRRAANAEARARDALTAAELAEVGKEAAARDANEAAVRAARAEAALRMAAQAGSRPPVQVTAPLACASLGRGDFEVFIHNGSAAARHLTRLGGAWEARQGIGLPEGQVSVIAAAYCHRLIRVILAVADGTSYLKQWWQQDDGWNCWADWKDLREGSQVVPAGVRDAAVASPASGRLDVFALDADGRICHRRGSARGRDGSWSPWQVIDAPEASAIAAASHEEQCLTLVAATDDGVQVNSWFHRDGWIGWRPLSPSTATDIACSSFGRGQIDVFMLGADGTIAHRDYSHKHWTDWTGVPGPAETITAITATAPAGQHPGLAVLTSDGIAHYADVLPNDRKPQWYPLPSLTLIAQFPSRPAPPDHARSPSGRPGYRSFARMYDNRDRRGEVYCKEGGAE